MHIDSYNCVLCQESVEEMTEHLFLHCQFAKECWNQINIGIPPDLSITEAAEQIRHQSHPDFFMMVTILMCWAIWIVRNDFIFKRVQPNISTAKAFYTKEMKILSLPARTRFTHTFDLWIQNLL
jgi:hypothetical protein